MSWKLLPILAAYCLSVESRGNVELGITFGSHLIYHETHEKYGIPLVYRSEEVFVEGVKNELIRAVVVHDLKGDGRAYVKSGGIGLRNVTIKLESGERGNGYKFMVDVFAM